VRDQFHRSRAREVEQPSLRGTVRDVVGLALVAAVEMILMMLPLRAVDHRTRDMLREKERPGQNDLDLTLATRRAACRHAFLLKIAALFTRMSIPPKALVPRR